MSIRGRALGVLSAAALGLSGLAVMAAPAQAATVSCGQILTASVTLSNSVGPCPGDGLVIAASGITVNLAGHTVRGSNTTNTTSTEQAGVTFRGVSNSTLTSGYVRNFDAGVQIVGGSSNTVTAVFAHDNINHSSLVSSDGAANNPCNLGDGIVTFDSNANQITKNTVYHNGPFDGIAMVEHSDNNVVSNNNVYNQTVSNELPPAGSNNNGPCGPFSATPTGAGRLHQDIGIRIEGPGAHNNQVLNNQVTHNQLNGISIHGYVCGSTGPDGPPLGTPDTGNLIQGNNVRGNGFPDGESGISILNQGPFGTIVCGSNHNSIIANTSSGNAGNGIYVTPTGDNSVTSSNIVSKNIVNSNGLDGIRLDGPFTVCPLGAPDSGPPNYTCLVPLETRNGANNNTISSNTGTGNGNNLAAFTDPSHPPAPIADDGFDGNPGCDANAWSRNIFGTVNQACVKANGGKGTVTGPLPVFP